MTIMDEISQKTDLEKRANDFCVGRYFRLVDDGSTHRVFIYAYETTAIRDGAKTICVKYYEDREDLSSIGTHDFIHLGSRPEAWIEITEKEYYKAYDTVKSRIEKSLKKKRVINKIKK